MQNQPFAMISSLSRLIKMQHSQLTLLASHRTSSPISACTRKFIAIWHSPFPSARWPQAARGFGVWPSPSRLSRIGTMYLCNLFSRYLRLYSVEVRISQPRFRCEEFHHVFAVFTFSVAFDKEKCQNGKLIDRPTNLFCFRANLTRFLRPSYQHAH